MLAQLSGLYAWLGYWYASGMRLMECARLRIKDLDFDYGHIVVRDAKGNKDRIVSLPERYVAALRKQIDVVKVRYNADRAAGCQWGISSGCPGVEIPTCRD